uniref:Carboxylic ester hydrolase n=1 Tax=Amphiprion percula TaxID=161767 RepID=A0A3P8UAX4_AMPPE
MYVFTSSVCLYLCVFLAAVCFLTLLMIKTLILGVVQTEAGQVEGRSYNMGLFRSIDVFKGVPFADVPGKWEKPKPHPGWDGVLKATKARERCLQVTLLQTKTQGSEDCLYLNIFVPQGRSLSSNLPVMVYLFGGAFLLGASNDVAILGDSLYDGKEMADRGKVIIVTVNYRVGTLGFLSTGDDRLPGNYGLWDQHAAISWVRRNIEAFGGNPDNITVFGQSAGAASVSYQMLSPYSKGLFRRAISQCGVALSPWALQKNPMRMCDPQIARKVGCWRSNEDEMISCLKMSDPVGLTMAGKIEHPAAAGERWVYFRVVMDLLELAPVVDGDFIPDDPSRLFHNAGQFDYMAGVNSMDGHIFAGVDVPSINQRNATKIEQVKGFLTRLTKEKGTAAADSAFDVYSAHWGSYPDPAVVKKTVADIETELPVPGSDPDRPTAARRQHQRRPGPSPTCSTLKTRIPGFPSWYLFGKPFSTPLVYFSRHRDLAGYMIAYWTNFARTGNPNSGESRVPVPWPEFTKYHRPYLTINSKMTKSSVSYDLRSDYVNYWTQTYSRLPAARTH